MSGKSRTAVEPMRSPLIEVVSKTVLSCALSYTILSAHFHDLGGDPLFFFLRRHLCLAGKPLVTAHDRILSPPIKITLRRLNDRATLQAVNRQINPLGRREAAEHVEQRFQF
jgi:hypothetical protein